MIFFIKYFFAFINNRFRFLWISFFFILNVILNKNYFNGYFLFFIFFYNHLKTNLNKTWKILLLKITILNLIIEIIHFHIFLIFKINSKLHGNLVWNIFQIKTSYYNTFWF